MRHKLTFDPALIRDLWALKLTDTEIARRLGVNRRTVARRLRPQGCPAHGQQAPTARQAQARRFARQLAQAGAAHLRAVNPPDARVAREKEELARSYGLPTDLTTTQVALLVTLAGGPKTTRELADLFSKRRDRKAYVAFGHNRCGNQLGDLRRRGLVGMANLCRGKGGGRGRGDGQWFLTALAMDLLSQPKKEDSHADPVP